MEICFCQACVLCEDVHGQNLRFILLHLLSRLLLQRRSWRYALEASNFEDETLTRESQ